MKFLTVVLAICMLSIIGCSNDNDTRVQELENQIKELQQAQAVSQTATPTPTPTPTPLPAPTPVPISNLIPVRGEIKYVSAGCYWAPFDQWIVGLGCFLYSGDKMWRDSEKIHHYWGVHVRQDDGSPIVFSIPADPDEFVMQKFPLRTEPRVGQRINMNISTSQLGYGFTP